MRSQVRTWIHGLFAALIGGAATAAQAQFGVAVAKGVGLEVTILNWKTLGIVMLSGAIPSVIAFLKQSPLPMLIEETQVTITKEVTPKQ